VAHSSPTPNAKPTTLVSSRSDLSLSKKRELELAKKKARLEQRQIENRKIEMYADSVTTSYRMEEQ
jgi:hypothetical protein